MNEPKEKDLLLKDQSKLVSQINNKTEVLLLEAETTKSHRDLKDILGWNEVDQEIDADKRQMLELQSAIKDFGTTDVIEESVLLNYCFVNNYVVTKLRDYKGKLLPDMLESIENYVKEQGWTMTDTNLSQLFILCSFSDVNADPLTSRYSKTKNNKVIILHKLDERNYSKTMFKIVSEHGKANKIKNFIRSLFFSHTRTLNMLNNSTAIMGVLILIMIIAGIINMIDRLSQGFGQSEYFLNGMNIFGNIAIIILIIKWIVPQVMEIGDGGPSINYHHDKFYDSIADTDFAEEHFSTSHILRRFPFKHLNRYNYKLNRNLKIRVELGRILIIIACYGLFNGMISLNRYIDVLRYGDRTHSVWVNANTGDYKLVTTSLSKNGIGYKTTTVYKNTIDNKK